MKALSVNQPWAWLIVSGHKPVENRDWETKFRGPVLIHAGKKFDNDFDWSVWERVIGAPIPTNPFMGGIVGMVEIVDCVTEHESPFFFGKFGFVLKNAKQLHNPRPCKGALGFFEPDYNSRYKEPAPKVKKQGALL